MKHSPFNDCRPCFFFMCFCKPSKDVYRFPHSLQESGFSLSSIFKVFTSKDSCFTLPSIILLLVTAITFELSGIEKPRALTASLTSSNCCLLSEDTRPLFNNSSTFSRQTVVKGKERVMLLSTDFNTDLRKGEWREKMKEWVGKLEVASEGRRNRSGMCSTAP